MKNLMIIVSCFVAVIATVFAISAPSHNDVNNARKLGQMQAKYEMYVDMAGKDNERLKELVNSFKNAEANETKGVIYDAFEATFIDAWTEAVNDHESKVVGKEVKLNNLMSYSRL